MDSLIVFIKNNWQILLSLLFQVVSFIILVTRKKVNISNVLVGLLTELPSYINDAEKTCLDGTAKFTAVFSRSVSYLMNCTGLTSQEVCNLYAKTISDAIENILGTPQKGA